MQRPLRAPWTETQPTRSGLALLTSSLVPFSSLSLLHCPMFLVAASSYSHPSCSLQLARSYAASPKTSPSFSLAVLSKESEEAALYP